jgi:FtsZ-binding cell division protein ZapB
MSDNISPQARGYIAELQQQVAMLSERCAQLSGQFYAARQQAELLQAELNGLRKQQGQTEEAADRADAAAPAEAT